MNGTSLVPPPKLAPAALANAIVSGAARRRRGHLSGRRRAGLRDALSREPEGAGARAVGSMSAAADGACRRASRTRACASSICRRRCRRAFRRSCCRPSSINARRSAWRKSRATTNAAQPGTGTISRSASTPARISMRRCTGSPAAICPRTHRHDSASIVRRAGLRDRLSRRSCTAMRISC